MGSTPQEAHEGCGKMLSMRDCSPKTQGQSLGADYMYFSVTGFWADPAISSVPDSARLLAAYLLTGPLANPLGVFRLSASNIQVDLKWQKKGLAEQRIGHLVPGSQQDGVCLFDSHHAWVFVFKIFSYCPPFVFFNNIDTIERIFWTVPREVSFYKDLVECLRPYASEFKYPIPANPEVFVPSKISSGSNQGASSVSADRRGQQNVATSGDDLGDVVVYLPLIEKNDQGEAVEYPVHEAYVREWESAYPAVDVRGQLRKMRSWCIANPDRRKTSKGIFRFVDNWLTRDQNRGGSRSRAGSNENKLEYMKRARHYLGNPEKFEEFCRNKGLNPEETRRWIEENSMS